MSTDKSNGSSWLSGLGSALKGAVFEETEDKTEPVSEKSTLQQTPNKNFQSSFSLPVSTPNNNSEKVAEIKAQIETSTLSRKTAFTALLEAAKKMETVIPDKNVRMQAAFAMVSNEQRTVAQMLSAIDIHLQDVDGEKLKFSRDANQHQQTKISSFDSANTQMQEQISSLENNIQMWNEQIKSATAQINDNQQRIAENAKAKVESVQQFESVNNAFNQAVEEVKQNLISQKSVIQSTFK